MIQDERLAKEVSGVLLGVLAKLNESVRLVTENGATEDLPEYRLAVGTVAAEVVELLNRLYAEHPSTKPPELM
jgi:hypothetical protein